MMAYKHYLAPEIEVILITQDVVRTSETDKGELPVQPFGSSGSGANFG